MILKLLSVVVVSTFLLSAGQAQDAFKLKPEVKSKALKVLRDGLQSDEFWPSIHAAEGLTIARQGDEVKRFLELKLKTEKDDQRRCGIARELVRAGDVARSSVMMNILKGSEPHGHVHAAESLYKVGWEGDSAPLEKVFAETDDIRLRLMAAAALAKHSDGKAGKGALAFLRKHLASEPDPALFRLSAWVLCRIGDNSDRELIRSRLKDANDDPMVHAFLEHGLAALGDPDGKKALLRNLKSEDPAIRTYAAVFAGESGIVEAAPDLIQQLNNENLDARIRAAQALFELSK